MGKRITNPIEVKITWEDGVIRSEASYGVACEHEIHARRGLLVTLNANTLQDVYEEAFPQIETEEGV